MNPTQTITRAELADKLRAIKGATFVTISALVDARAKKTGNPFTAVLKLSKVNGTVGADYQASVNRQLAREGKDHIQFEASGRQWGERISSALVVKGEGAERKEYLAIQPNHTRQPVYFGKTPDGLMRQVSKETIAAFLPAHKPSAIQGTDKEIVYRNYALSSIAAISIGGQKYRIRDIPSPTVKPRKPSAIKGTSFMSGASVKPLGSDGPISEEHCRRAQKDEWRNGERVSRKTGLTRTEELYPESIQDDFQEGWDGHKV